MNTQLLLSGIDHTTHVQQALSGLVIDEEQERPIEGEPRRKSVHEDAGEGRGSRASLLIHFHQDLLQCLQLRKT